MTFVVVFYCGFSTWWTIREHRGASDRTRHLHRQLFKALVFQVSTGPLLQKSRNFKSIIAELQKNTFITFGDTTKNSRPLFHQYLCTSQLVSCSSLPFSTST